MESWELYESRLHPVGYTKRDMWVNHTKASIRRRLLASPSCRDVLINGIKQTVSIVHQSEMTVKKICALPGEHLEHGGLVDFAGNKWLITDIDADNEIYEKGLMLQCNHILRWISKDGELREKWCHVEDGTKYLIGEKAADIMSIGDARIAVTVGKDAETIELSRGLRFLIDDTDSESVLAYQITKPNKLFNVYNGKGVFKFILNEVNLTDDDNKTLRIADYTNWKPPRELDGDHVDSEITVAEIVEAAFDEAYADEDDGKEVWL